MILTADSSQLAWGMRNAQWTDAGDDIQVRYLGPGQFEIETESQWIIEVLAEQRECQGGAGPTGTGAGN